VSAWWAQANAMRSPQEKNTRLENMTWRIWNLARKKKEVLFPDFIRIVFLFVLVLRFLMW
jgi:cytoskeletal protein RodZ